MSTTLKEEKLPWLSIFQKPPFRNFRNYHSITQSKKCIMRFGKTYLVFLLAEPYLYFFWSLNPTGIFHNVVGRSLGDFSSTLWSKEKGGGGRKKIKYLLSCIYYGALCRITRALTHCYFYLYLKLFWLPN